MWVVIDLSYLPNQCIDSGVPKSIYFGTTFKLHYLIIDIIIQRLCDIGHGAHIYKIDPVYAFKQLFVDPYD